MKSPSTKVFFVATSLLALTVELWTSGDVGGEFVGGRVTGPLIRIADIGSVLFAIAIILMFFRVRVAAGIALAASALSLPLHVYFAVPRLFWFVFAGEYTYTVPGILNWDDPSFVGIICILCVGWVSILAFRQRPAPGQSHGET